MKAVDLFAGFGGFSAGASQAGVNVVWAANHWRFAVDAHAAQHPSIKHECQDLRQADWSALPDFDLLLAAPACQGHSSASQPHRRGYHNAMRATAWAVVDCAEITTPRAIIVENVPAFRRWKLFPIWCQALELLGYSITELDVRASDHGVPQRRDRLFICATRGGTLAQLSPASREPAFGPSIDWSAGRWKPVAQAARGAQTRIARAIARHGARTLSQHVTGHSGVSLSQPIRTVTTKDQWCVVDGSRYRALTLREHARAMGFADSWHWPAGASRANVIRGLGNAVCPPVGRAVVSHVLDHVGGA